MQFIHSNKKYIERTMYPINPYTSKQSGISDSDLLLKLELNNSGVDISPLHNDILSSTNTSFAQDRKGNSASSLAFSGNGNAILTNTITIGATKDFSISAWIYINNDHLGGIIEQENPSGYSFGLYMYDGKIRFCVNNYGNSEIWFPATYGQWIHVVCVKNSSNMKLYKNGILVSENTGYSNNSLSFKIIGAYNSSSWRAFNGRIDDIIVVNRELSLQEIQEIYNL